MTFSQCVTAYIEAHGDGWKNPKHRAQWQSTLDTYAGPFIGNLDVALVDTGLVLKCLEPYGRPKTKRLHDCEEESKACCPGQRLADTGLDRTRHYGKVTLIHCW
jgi:hypothetical protein